MSRFYQFILVFETEVCQHYLSPQLFRVLASTDLIPVVFGGINYSKLFKVGSSRKMLHKHDFQLTIDALNQTPKALAHYIKRLAQDRDAAGLFYRCTKHSL